MSKYLVALSIVLNFTMQAHATCPFQPWDEYQTTSLLREKPRGPYIFVTDEVKVDADGAPNAYHPDDVGLHCTRGEGFKGLDCPANGGYPNSSWWRSAIVPDPNDNDIGYVQPDGATKGFFVSQTSLSDNLKSNIDPTKFVDSNAIPYIVFPGNFSTMSGTGLLGDYGYALNLENGKSSAFIVADIGPPEAHLGEISISLAVGLGGVNPNPRTGAGVPKEKIAYIIFPYSKSSPRWPLTNEEITATVFSLLSEVGGSEILKNCADEL